MMENMLKEHPKVSVIIPVYGVEAFIERCARALFEQTLDSIEYLFIDDCTPDRSIDILKQVLQEYPQRAQQVTIHRMEQNSGQAKVREWGMRNVTGEFVIHCDSDDWPEVTMYEDLYGIARKENTDIVFCDYYRVDPKGYKKLYARNIPTEKECLLGAVLGKYHKANALWGALVRRTLLEGLLYPIGNQGEDWALMVQLLFKCKSYSVTSKPLYNYSINPNSLQRSIDDHKLLKRAYGYAENIKMIQFFLEEKGIYNNYFDQLVEKKFCARNLLSENLSSEKCRNSWFTIFPEIDSYIFTNPFISLKSKIKHFSLKFGLWRLIIIFQ